MNKKTKNPKNKKRNKRRKITKKERIINILKQKTSILLFAILLSIPLYIYAIPMTNRNDLKVNNNANKKMELKIEEKTQDTKKESDKLTDEEKQNIQNNNNEAIENQKSTTEVDQSNYPKNTIHYLNKTVYYINNIDDIKSSQTIINENKNIVATDGEANLFSGEDEKNTLFLGYNINGAFSDLANLKMNDEIIITDSDQNHYNYTVSKKYICDENGVDNNGINQLEEITKSKDTEEIALVTTIGKQSEKALIIIVTK